MAHDINPLATISPPAEPVPDRLACAFTHTGPRLSLAPGQERRGPLDGGWWPRSHDTVPELTELVTALNRSLGTVTGLMIAAEDWDWIPDHIVVGRDVIEVSGLPDLRNMIIVTQGSSEEFLLLVVPPAAKQSAALTALDRATSATHSARPQEILATCDISTAPTRDRAARRTVPPAEGAMMTSPKGECHADLQSWRPTRSLAGTTRTTRTTCTD